MTIYTAIQYIAYCNFTALHFQKDLIVCLLGGLRLKDEF